MGENRWATYEARKQAWLDSHPDATAAEIEEFCKRLAEELDI